MRAGVFLGLAFIRASSYTNQIDSLKASFVMIDIFQTFMIKLDAPHADNLSLLNQNSDEKYLNHPVNIGFGPAIGRLAGQLERFSFFYSLCDWGLFFEVVQN